MKSFKIDQVLTDDGSYTIRHPDYDEEFHSKTGARLETLELYMKASGYAADVQTRQNEVQILDVGLGLGYNALMTLEVWMRSPGLAEARMLSLEHTPELLEALTSPDTAWKEGWSPEWKLWSQSLQRHGDGWRANFTHPQSGKTFAWQCQVGDARVADFAGYAFDYVWQDAFSSKKNPELWTKDWFAKIKAESRPSACLVTYSVARLVRDSLEAGGWWQERFQACGAKRHWLRAGIDQGRTQL